LKIMKRLLHPSAPPSLLSESLHRHLSSYALAASAAGVSLLALAQPSEARVVYTKTHQAIGWNGVYELDLTHHGTIDFLIQEVGGSTSGLGVNALLAQGALGNSVLGSTTNGNASVAAALTEGSPIGPGQGFLKAKYPGDVMAHIWNTERYSGTSGRWWNVTGRYLGLKIKIDGETHYGWARLGVKRNRGFKITATLTGYAYETIPDKGILAGQTAGRGSDSTTSPASANPDVNPPHPAETRSAKRPTGSLGALALGHQGLPMRRWQQ